MADTTVLTPAQIAAQATAGAPRTVTPAVVATVAVKDTSFRFYMADPASPLPGVHVEVRNNGFVADLQLASLGGAGSGFPITAAEAAALQALLLKMHVGIVMP